MKNNIVKLLIFAFALILMSCNFNKGKLLVKPEKQWVYIELVTESKKDTSEYFYYGQITKSLIDKIESNEEKKGLFLLSNIRFWNDDGFLELYEDNGLTGSLIFKIQDIEEVILYKNDPINFFDMEKLHESAKKLRMMSKKLK